MQTTREQEMTPALLTRSEVDWLLGNRQVSKSYERKIRHDIKKKLQILMKIELPLLASKGYDVTANGNGVTANGNDTSRCLLLIAQSSSKVLKNDRLIQSIGLEDVVAEADALAAARAFLAARDRLAIPVMSFTEHRPALFYFLCYCLHACTSRGAWLI